MKGARKTEADIIVGNGDASADRSDRIVAAVRADKSVVQYEEILKSTEQQLATSRVQMDQ